MSGKRQRVGSKGRLRQPLKRAPQEQECDQECKPPYIGEIHFSNTVKCVSQLTGLICNIETSILLDTGSSLSLVNTKIAKESKMPISHMKSVYVKTACNDHVELSSYLYLTIKIGGLEKKHKFLICDNLVFPVILGTDFMVECGIEIDYKHQTVKANKIGIIWPTVSETSPFPQCQIHTKPLWENAYTASTIIPDDIEQECSIPVYSKQPTYTLPKCNPQFTSVIQKYSELFSSVPGKTNTVQHHIPTGTAAPVRVPARRIPNHYRAEIEHQIGDMLEQGIIVESTSPWLAPCVFVPKKNGEIRICVDYRELNKRTQKNSYPLPLPDEVQEKIGKSQVFSKLDCRKGFWQVPLCTEDQHKTAFSPGPGMGLYEFTHLPFGLTGAPGTFQLLMDHVLRGLDYVIVYVDDILVFSKDVDTHILHLEEVFNRLKSHNITLHAEKCDIGCDEVAYLGHIFNKKGMSPDPAKTQVIHNWAVPNNITELRRFLGLASYYRRYIQNFSTIAEPLYCLTNKETSYHWTTD